MGFTGRSLWGGPFIGGFGLIFPWNLFADQGNSSREEYTDKNNVRALLAASHASGHPGVDCRI